MDQVVFTPIDDALAQEVSSFLTHPLLIPSYFAILSIVVLLAQAIFSSGPIRRLRGEDTRVIATRGDSGVAVGATRTGFVSTVKDHMEKSGGSIIFLFQVLRLVVVLTLLGLAIFSSVNEEGQQHAFSSSALYAAFLGLMTLTARRVRTSVASLHLSLLLLGTFSVYAYRNIWPLLTFTLSPVDACEGPLLWDPQQAINPEQTASLLSMMLYTFLDPIVFLAYRVPHLSHDMLPPLADYDYTRNLHLDTFSGGPRRHIFWGILVVFRRESIQLAIFVAVKVFSTLMAPFGMNQLLRYLETRGEGAVIRPWVWVACIFLGPALGTIAFQWYNFIATGTFVRVTAIVTQLVFEHALRIRVKVETSQATPEIGSEAMTSDSESVVEVNIVSEEAGGSGEETRSEQSTIAASSVKGERKDEASRFDSDGAGGSSNLVGKMNNLVSTDLENIVDGRDFLLLVLYIPLQMVIYVWFLYSVLGWSVFAGMAVMVALLPIPGTVAGKIQKIQRETAKRTDARVQAATETMGILRMIKLFGWEPKIAARLAEKRDQELRYIKLRQILIVINGNINFFIPVITMVVTYVTYHRPYFRPWQLQSIFWMIPMFIRARVSLDRVNDFLHHTELLDEFADADKGSERVMLTDASRFDQDVIGFQNASFTWANDDPDGMLVPSRRRFTLRVHGELLFKRGCFNLIIGPTGSGKTSLLMALLGEMHFVPMNPDSWYHLPRQGGVSYAAQESWVQNETIRSRLHILVLSEEQDNILFGAAYDEERYNKVIYQCGLQHDLSLFDAGDKTEVGEKGLTLSGGQKARVTLARAVYSSSHILLLDDVGVFPAVLAALDVHTARWIVEKCFKGDIIRGRTILLVTHNVAMATPLADYVVLLGKDGRIARRGSVSDALEKDKVLAKEFAEGTSAIKADEKKINSEKPEETAKLADGKLILVEEISEGNVSWDAVYAAGMLLFSTLMTVQTWFMGYWAEQYNIYPPEQVNITLHTTVYVLIILVATASYTMGFGVYMFGALRASRTIHRTLIESVLGTTLRWLDTTPTSRIITRVTQDIRALDSPLADAFFWAIEVSVAMLLKFVAVVYLTPGFSVPGIAVAVLGAWLGRVYMKAQIAIKREMSNAKAPVLGHFGASVAGLVSIRAYGAQLAFREESYRRIDKWINLRTDFLGGLFAASLAAYLIYLPNERSLPSDTGFSLTMAIGFSSLILWWVRNLNNFEVTSEDSLSCVTLLRISDDFLSQQVCDYVLICATYSLERMHSYINAEQEPKPTEQGTPPAYWPASGDLRVEKLSARYSHDGPKVLHDISFHIKSGERVGVVGRTGSGKSSLTLSLLRCIFTEGSVYYDGRLTSSINLDALRSNITIIPQIPELLSGSLRENIDPFSQYDDAALNSALHASGLFSLQTEDEDGHLTLDSQIASGGGNLSVGQRQILALARAIVRGSKLLILDEATSAIDYKTDTIIQTSLRTELRGDITLITVAHRLQTIIDADKVMVLDAGRIVEFDKPSELLKLENGRFRSLVDESGDRELLYSIASSAGNAQH
ncbi:P-loop containing nucleoside triphosphate hydrolase protein [Lactarius hatsudake]|nr:P-loop containing nucleoside triphosphate hydrolase protein [Lactarius hatsudake]